MLYKLINNDNNRLYEHTIFCFYKFITQFSNLVLVFSLHTVNY